MRHKHSYCLSERRECAEGTDVTTHLRRPMVVLITDFLLAAWVVFWVIGLLGGSGVGKRG